MALTSNGEIQVVSDGLPPGKGGSNLEVRVGGVNRTIAYDSSGNPSGYSLQPGEIKPVGEYLYWRGSGDTTYRRKHAEVPSDQLAADMSLAVSSLYQGVIYRHGGKVYAHASGSITVDKSPANYPVGSNIAFTISGSAALVGRYIKLTDELDERQMFPNIFNAEAQVGSTPTVLPESGVGYFFIVGPPLGSRTVRCDLYATSALSGTPIWTMYVGFTVT